MKLSLFQNPVGFGQALRKTGPKPGFSVNFKEAVPKTGVLELPQLSGKKNRCLGLPTSCGEPQEEIYLYTGGAK
jgi:hypothetical protein